jgi:hypothetical protein
MDVLEVVGPETSPVGQGIGKVQISRIKKFSPPDRFTDLHHILHHIDYSKRRQIKRFNPTVETDFRRLSGSQVKIGAIPVNQNIE